MGRSVWFASAALVALGCSSGESRGPLLDLGKADTLSPVCSFDTAFVGGDSSQDLVPSVTAGREVNADALASLSPLEKRQLVAAFVQLDMFSASEDLGADAAQVFSLADEGNVEFLDLQVASDAGVQSFDWIRFHAGDNEVGVIFADDSQSVVAEISDGDILGCSLPAADLNGVMCAADGDGATSAELAGEILSGRELSADDVDASEAEVAQLIAVAAHAGVEASSVQDVLAIADEGTIEILKLGEEEDGEVFIVATWVRYFAADSEKGVIFEGEGADIVADVDAGVLRMCISQQELIDNEVEIILDDKGLDGIDVAVPFKELRAQEALPGNVVDFKEALGKALDAFLTDSEDAESPLALVIEEIGSEGVAGVECLETLDPQEALSCILNKSGRLELLRFGQSPETGGSVEDSWIFVLRTDFSDHLHWAVVDRTDPNAPVSVTGFN